VGAFAENAGSSLRLLAVVVAPDGSKQLRVNVEGSSNAPEALGQRAAAELLSKGAAQLLAPCD